MNRYSGPHGGCQITGRTPVRWREKKIRTYLPLVHPQLLSCELGHHQQTQTKNLQPIMAIFPEVISSIMAKLEMAKNVLCKFDEDIAI